MATESSHSSRNALPSMHGVSVQCDPEGVRALGNAVPFSPSSFSRWPYDVFRLALSFTRRLEGFRNDGLLGRSSDGSTGYAKAFTTYSPSAALHRIDTRTLGSHRRPQEYRSFSSLSTWEKNERTCSPISNPGSPCHRASNSSPRPSSLTSSATW